MIYKNFGLSGNHGYGNKQISTSRTKTLNATCHRSAVPKTSCRLPIWPTTTPPVTPIEQRTPSVPRNRSGASSDKYIGTVLVVSPEAKPTRRRPIRSISTEAAMRQKKKKTAPLANRPPQVNNDPFLEIWNKSSHLNSNVCEWLFKFNSSSPFKALHLIKTNLPNRSAIQAPPSEPTAPPTRNIDTIAAHSTANSLSDNQLSYLWISVSLHQARTCFNII